MCVSETCTDKEVKKQEKTVFFRRRGARKKGKCVKNKSSFCHAVVPPALHSLPLSLPLSLFVSLPFLPLSVSPPPSCLFDLFSLQILQLFYSLPCQCCFFLCACVCVRESVCKRSRCLSLSLSDVQQLLKGSFSLPLTHSHKHTLILCTSFNLFPLVSLIFQLSLIVPRPFVSPH